MMKILARYIQWLRTMTMKTGHNNNTHHTHASRVGAVDCAPVSHQGSRSTVQVPGAPEWREACSGPHNSNIRIHSPCVSVNDYVAEDVDSRWSGAKASFRGWLVIRANLLLQCVVIITPHCCSNMSSILEPVVLLRYVVIRHTGASPQHHHVFKTMSLDWAESGTWFPCRPISAPSGYLT